MKIRVYHPSDLAAIKAMHAQSGLPPECLPPVESPLLFVKLVAEEDGKVTQAGFVKLTGEAYVLVDHEHGTAERRFETLRYIVAHGLNTASREGLQDVSCWLPPEVQQSFGARLESLGFIKSPWQSYTALLE
jgi:hypothetical protein